MKYRRKSNAKLRAAQEEVAERDDHTCQVCGEAAQDIAHILPRSYRSIREAVENLIALCRDCHPLYETLKGRRKLLKQQRKAHGYDYSGYPYCQYIETEE